MNEDEELVQAFLEESRENLDQMDLDLVELETRPTDPELLARVFRAIHTIKGTSGFLGLRELETLSHAGEDVLGELRSGQLGLNAEITTLLLRMVDEVRAVLDRVGRDGDEGNDDHASLITDLAGIRSAGSPVAVSGSPRSVGGAQPASSGVSTAPPAAPAAAGTPDAPPSAGETTVRVDVVVLDTLQDLVGELTQANSRLGVAVEGDAGVLSQSYQQVQYLARELRDGVMAARMQPIGTVIGKAHRIVRDVATSLGKSVRVEVTGEDVGVDRSVIEALRDPMTHLIRNAVDHGIESPDERVRVGKPAEALLRIDASVESGRVRIDFTDDGRGINLDRVVERSVDLGFVTREAAAAMSDEQRIELIFRPGLSSRVEANVVSGRGVGMDIVRANLDRIGGGIEVTTAFGLGSRFRIELPLTQAIIPGLIVGCDGVRYVIPQADVHTILQMTAEDVGKLDDVHGARTYRWHGRLLPLVEFAASLHLRTEPSPIDGTLVVVVRSHGRLFGLVVDSVNDTMEAVVKPLPSVLRAVAQYSGVTILPSGEPALILEASGIGAAAGILAATIGDLDNRPDQRPPAALLLATDVTGEPVAFPLDAVHRIELLLADQVQHSGGLDVVQYGNVLLPLVPVAVGAVETPAPDRTPTAFVMAVVCTTTAGLVGLTVQRIDDVAARPDVPAQPAKRHGVAARLVVDDRVTELLDLEALVAHAGVVAIR